MILVTRLYHNQNGRYYLTSWTLAATHGPDLAGRDVFVHLTLKATANYDPNDL
jgi:hypothetical protein